MNDKTAVSAQWVNKTVGNAKVMPGRLDRFFNKMTDTSTRAGLDARTSAQVGKTRRNIIMGQVSDRAGDAAVAAADHPKFPMNSPVGGFKTAGLKETLMTDIPGTKPWLLGRAGLGKATAAVSKARPRAIAGAARDSSGAYDVSSMARQMGLHSKTASAFAAELGAIIQEKIASGIEPTTRAGKFLSGAKHEVGPAAGATIGAGLAKAYGVDPLSGAALGYGAGSLPEIIGSAWKARKAARAL